MDGKLKVGIGKSARLKVDRGRTIGFIGDDARVYATPAMIGDIETLCRELLLEHLDAGQDLVGTRVAIDHLAATPVDLDVELSATVSAVDGRLVTFEVTGEDPVEEIVRGTHTRFIVDVEKTHQRIAAKVDKARAA